jgi:hypothetical protein
MTATVAQLAARALRKTGLAPVALADHPSSGSVVTLALTAARALRLLGINPVSEADAAANSGTTTYEAVATRALRRLGVVAADETPVTADTTLAEEKSRAVHEMLAATGLITWASSAIPLSVAEHYAVMAAHLIAPAFGQAGDVAGFDAAFGHVRVIALSGAAGQALAEAEVTAAHQTLNALGYVTWAISAIPESAATHYATMAASRLAPALGRPADDKGYAAAVSLVRQFAMAGATGQAMAEQKVRAAHASLDARGMTRWTLADIPDYAEEPLVMMAAELLAPEVGQPAINGMYLAGEREIRRVVAMPSSGTPVVAVYF